MHRVLLLLALVGAALAETSCDSVNPCDITEYCDLSEGTPGVCVERTLCDPGTYAEAVAPTFDQDTICADCDDDCLTCFGPSDEECTSCGTGYFLQDPEIEAESLEADALLFGHCEECTECDAGTFEKHACTPISDTVCVDCPASCPAGTRSPCASPGTGTEDACLPCGPAASACTDTEATACFDGFLLQEGKCVACSSLVPNCAYCSLKESTVVCGLCQEGFYVSAGVCKSVIRASPPPPSNTGVNNLRSPPPPPKPIGGR